MYGGGGQVCYNVHKLNLYLHVCSFHYKVCVPLAVALKESTVYMVIFAGENFAFVSPRCYVGLHICVMV